MADSSEMIKVSPSLSEMFERVKCGEYCLYWIDGFIRTYINREDIIIAYVRRYKSLFKDWERKGKGHARGGLEQTKFKINLLLADFKKLSHTDIDILRRLRPGEAMPREITTINNKTVILSQFVKEN